MYVDFKVSGRLSVELISTISIKVMIELLFRLEKRRRRNIKLCGMDTRPLWKKCRRTQGKIYL